MQIHTSTVHQIYTSTVHQIYTSTVHQIYTSTVHQIHTSTVHQMNDSLLVIFLCQKRFMDLESWETRQNVDNEFWIWKYNNKLDWIKV